MKTFKEISKDGQTMVEISGWHCKQLTFRCSGARNPQKYWYIVRRLYKNLRNEIGVDEDVWYLACIDRQYTYLHFENMAESVIARELYVTDTKYIAKLKKQVEKYLWNPKGLSEPYKNRMRLKYDGMAVMDVLI